MPAKAGIQQIEHICEAGQNQVLSATRNFYLAGYRPSPV
jgi:hypothetical protein